MTESDWGNKIDVRKCSCTRNEHENIIRGESTLNIQIIHGLMESIRMVQTMTNWLKTSLSYQGIHGIFDNSFGTNPLTIPDSTESRFKSNHTNPITQFQPHESNYTVQFNYTKCFDYALFFHGFQLHKLCNWKCMNFHSF